MKNIIYILSLITLFFFTGCKKEDTKDVSKVTTYAIFKLKGAEAVVVVKGDTYADSGAVALEGTKELTVTSTSNVDLNTMGVYTITYSAKNSDGFEATASRAVIVLPQVPTTTDDLSGKYQRTAGKKGISVWTKIAKGVYKCTDVGGAALTNDYVYVFNLTPNNLVVPPQPIGGKGSEVYCTNADGGNDITFTPGAVGVAKYAWVVNNSGYGAATRTFIRVE